MRAFHSKLKIKTKYLNRVMAHRKADEIVQSYGYWEHGKGCAVGCTIHGSSHKAYEDELGIPRIIARLEDRIFEGLPNKLSKTWPERFLKAIKPGADLSLVWDKFASRLLTDPVGGVIQYAKTEEQIEIIQRVSDLYEAKIMGLEVSIEDWRESSSAAAYAYAAFDAAYTAADAAAAAAYAAAYAAADVAYTSADVAYTSADVAYTSAAYAAADAAAAAAYAAADVAYTSADVARQKAYIFQSELLLELLKEA